MAEPSSGPIDMRRDLELRPVVAFEQAGDEIGHRMFAKIGRHIGDAQTVVMVFRAGHSDDQPRGYRVLRKTAGHSDIARPATSKPAEGQNG